MRLNDELTSETLAEYQSNGWSLSYKGYAGDPTWTNLGSMMGRRFRCWPGGFPTPGERPLVSCERAWGSLKHETNQSIDDETPSEYGCTRKRDPPSRRRLQVGPASATLARPGADDGPSIGRREPHPARTAHQMVLMSLCATL